MRAVAITYTPYLTRALCTLMVMIVCFVGLYGFFLLQAVGNTADRAAAEREIAGAASHIASLEGRYLALTRTMTPERAAELGFVAPARISTVYVSEPASLSRNQ